MQEKQDRNTYVSCDWVHNGLEFRHNSIRTCCYAYLQDVSEHNSTIISDYHGELLDWAFIVKNKEAHIKLHKANKTLPYCKGCVYLREESWDDEVYIDHLILNHWSKCNCNCIYCYTAFNKEDANSFQNYNMYPVIKDMIDRKILRATPTSCIIFGGGEPTILENFDEIIDLLLENSFNNIRINSSGIKYSKSIENGIRRGALSLVISPDAGSKEIYEKIKRVKCFDKVWDNITSYAKIIDETSASKFGHPAFKGVDQNIYELLKVKYIIIPGINDNINEIDKWFQMVIKSGAKAVSVSVEQYWYDRTSPNFSKKVYDMIYYMRDKSKSFGLSVELSVDSISLLKKYEENLKNVNE